MYSMLTAALAITVASLAATPAFATSGLTPASGEASASPHAMPSNVTRAQVKQEMSATLAGLARTANVGEAWGGQERPASLGGAATPREQVRQEHRASRSSPMSSDGWQMVGGEAGWRFGRG